MATARAGAAKRKAADGAAGDGNGSANGKIDERALEDLLGALQKAGDGDFSTRACARAAPTSIGDLQRAFNAHAASATRR